MILWPTQNMISQMRSGFLQLRKHVLSVRSYPYQFQSCLVSMVLHTYNFTWNAHKVNSTKISQSTNYEYSEKDLVKSLQAFYYVCAVILCKNSVDNFSYPQWNCHGNCTWDEQKHHCPCTSIITVHTALKIYNTIFTKGRPQAHSSGRPSRVNFASGQVDFQHTCPDRLDQILEKKLMEFVVKWANYRLYSSTRILVKHLAYYNEILIFNIRNDNYLWKKNNLGKLIFIGASHPEGQVEVNS